MRESFVSKLACRGWTATWRARERTGSGFALARNPKPAVSAALSRRFNSMKDFLRKLGAFGGVDLRTYFRSTCARSAGEAHSAGLGALRRRCFVCLRLAACGASDTRKLRLGSRSSFILQRLADFFAQVVAQFSESCSMKTSCA